MKTLALVLVLAGPQWATVEGWVMEGNPYAVPDGAPEVLATANALCPISGRIEWYTERFMCGDRLSSGCVFEYDPPRIGVTFTEKAVTSTLPHELAHVISAKCGGDVRALAAEIRSRVQRSAH